MGSRGGNAPNPYARHQVSTLFLRVPSEDWPRVKIGEKTEFRAQPKEATKLLSVKCPTPVVAYRRNGLGEYDGKLMVLEGYRYEPLFAISNDSEALAREGFDSYDEFRRYYRKRRHGVYRPMERVWVFRLRPLDGNGDRANLAGLLFERLYEEWL